MRPRTAQYKSGAVEESRALTRSCSPRPAPRWGRAAGAEGAPGRRRPGRAPSAPPRSPRRWRRSRRAWPRRHHHHTTNGETSEELAAVAAPSSGLVPRPAVGGALGCHTDGVAFGGYVLRGDVLKNCVDSGYCVIGGEAP